MEIMNNKQFDYDSLDWRSILKDVLLHCWVILLAALAVWFAAKGIYSLTYKPEYTSSAILSVNVRTYGGGTDSSLALTSDMASVFQRAFESETLKKKIAQSLGTKELNGEISVETITETNLLTLSAVSDTGKNAYRMINAALENYDTVSDYLFSNARIDILKEPSVPYYPSNGGFPTATVRKVMLAAALLALLAICFFSYLRPTVKNEASAKNRLDGRILGTIPYTKKPYTKEEKKAILLNKDKPKKSVLISSFLLGVPFIESVKKVSTLLEGHMRRRNQKVILLTSANENEGKSSLVCNLAMAFAEKQFKVLLIDADMKKPAMYKILEQKPVSGHSLSACIMGKISREKIQVRLRDNLYCLFQYTGLPDSERVIADENFGKLIEECRPQFDYIFVDTSPMTVSVDAETLLQAVDTAAIVVRRDRAEIGVINDISDILKKSDAEFIGFILNAFPRSGAFKSHSKYTGYKRSETPSHSKKEEKI